MNSAALPTIQCHFHSCGFKIITHLTIVSSSKLSCSSESNSVNLSSVTIRDNLTEKTLRNGRFQQEFAENKTYVSAMGEERCSRKERRDFWRKSAFGTKKLRGIILLNVITIIYGKLVELSYQKTVFLCLFDTH